ncbi:bifunctional protein-serine/threonine kinase/phosphatase [Thioclava sp. GXIMD2076]|uniref:bifunctional protein-serine/threonine kinase/phosphatase n=1 Tax=Thioclava sp. GXIMD2076 TaxID=3131931 RepID=UPI0030CF0809
MGTRSVPSYARMKDQFPTHPLKAVMGGYSTAGPKPRNDDAISGRIPSEPYELHAKGAVICIADGISTGRNSDKAAQMAVLQFAQDYYSAPESWTVADCSARLISALNSFFHAQNRSGSPEAEGQVTTFTALIARGQSAHIVHLGDTRCLRLRGAALEVLTTVHTTAYMGNGQALTRALGIDSHVQVDYREEVMQAGDLYLLLSDGVHGVLGLREIGAVLADLDLGNQKALEKAAWALCDAALKAGSDDNLSAMLMRIVALPSESLTEAHQRLARKAIPPALSPGNRIDGYEVTQVLHASTRSHVYRVRRADLEGSFVLKAPSRNFAEDLHYLEAFALEQWVGRRIDHPQVMKILPQEDSRFLYCIAEWVEGETLRDWMRRHPVPSLAQVLPVLSSLIAAMRVFHRLGMVHRDLKPENVMVMPDGRAKIIDFGSVQVAGFKGLLAGFQTERPEGSLNYIAPEVLTGQGATKLSDLFSIGAIAYEMLAGQVPFDLEDRAGHLSSKPSDWALKPLVETRSDLPEAIGEALMRVLSFDPKARPVVMSEFLADLRSAQSQGALVPEFVPLLQRGSKGFWRAWALGASALALALGVMLVLGSGFGQP